MLTLSRKVREVILIGDDIEVHIMRIGPNTVRVGVQAPSHITILRKELDDATVEDNSSVSEIQGQ